MTWTVWTLTQLSFSNHPVAHSAVVLLDYLVTSIQVQLAVMQRQGHSPWKRSIGPFCYWRTTGTCVRAWFVCKWLWTDVYVSLIQRCRINCPDGCGRRSQRSSLTLLSGSVQFTGSLQQRGLPLMGWVHIHFSSYLFIEFNVRPYWAVTKPVTFHFLICHVVNYKCIYIKCLCQASNLCLYHLVHKYKLYAEG